METGLHMIHSVIATCNLKSNYKVSAPNRAYCKIVPYGASLGPQDTGCTPMAGYDDS